MRKIGRHKVKYFMTPLNWDKPVLRAGLRTLRRLTDIGTYKDKMIKLHRTWVGEELSLDKAGAANAGKKRCGYTTMI